MSDPFKLPEPDTHCWDDDERRDVWSYSPELVREIRLAAFRAGVEAAARVADKMAKLSRPGHIIEKLHNESCDAVAAAIRALPGETAAAQMGGEG